MERERGRGRGKGESEGRGREREREEYLKTTSIVALYLISMPQATSRSVITLQVKQQGNYVSVYNYNHIFVVPNNIDVGRH